MVQPIFQRAIRADLQINKLEAWLKSQGFTLIKGKSRKIVDEVKMEKRLVFLSTRQNLTNQLYALAHECRTYINPIKLKEIHPRISYACSARRKRI